MSEKKRYAHLDGIRGVAAIIVFFKHAKETFWLGMEDRLYAYFFEHLHSSFIAKLLTGFLTFFFDGELAVYIFWFMSGYVISIKLFTPDSRFYLIGAVAKRYFRLLIPVSGAIMFSYLLKLNGLMYNVTLANVFGGPYVDNWLGGQVNFDPDLYIAIRSSIWLTFFDFHWNPCYNTALWTMSPELYGSLFCFFLFGVGGIFRRRYFLYGFFFLIFLGLKNFWMCTFIAGFLLCDIEHSHNRLTVVLNSIGSKILSRDWIAVFVLLILILISELTGIRPFMCMPIGALIVFVVHKSEILRRFFSNRLMLVLGRISFSIYLLHIPILCSLTSYLYIILDGSHFFKSSISILAGLLMSVVLSWFYTVTVDDFAVWISNRIGRFISSASDRTLENQTL